MLVVVSKRKQCICPVHGLALMDDYGAKYGAWIRCPRWGDCRVKATKSQHDGKYRMTDQSVRDARMEAHAAFDPLWKVEGHNRSRLYARLAKLLGIKNSDCHMEHFDVAQCRMVVRVVPILRAWPKTAYPTVCESTPTGATP